MFDRVPKSRRRHHARVLIEEREKQLSVDPFAELTKGPSDSFVHQIFSIAEEQFRNMGCMTSVLLTKRVVRRDHSDTPIPEELALRKLRERPTLFTRLKKHPAHNLCGRKINEVPVIDLFRAPQIEIEDRALLFRSNRINSWLDTTFAKLGDQKNQCTETHLVPFALQRLFDLVELHRLKVSNQCAGFGHLYAEKLVPFGILPLPGLEEPHEKGGGLRVSLLFECDFEIPREGRLRFRVRFCRHRAKNSGILSA